MNVADIIITFRPSNMKHTELFVGETRRLVEQVGELLQGRVGEITASLALSAAHRKSARKTYKRRNHQWPKIYIVSNNYLS